MEGLKPFNVHERDTQLNETFPSLRIELGIEPFFVFGQAREDTSNIYDNLTISFPRLEKEHQKARDIGLRLYPLDRLKSLSNTLKGDLSMFFSANCQIHSSVPRELTIGFIRAYLRKFCLDEYFY